MKHTHNLLFFKREPKDVKTFMYYTSYNVYTYICLFHSGCFAFCFCFSEENSSEYSENSFVEQKKKQNMS